MSVSYTGRPGEGRQLEIGEEVIVHPGVRNWRGCILSIKLAGPIMRYCVQLDHREVPIMADPDQLEPLANQCMGGPVTKAKRDEFSRLVAAAQRMSGSMAGVSTTERELRDAVKMLGRAVEVLAARVDSLESAGPACCRPDRCS